MSETQWGVGLTNESVSVSYMEGGQARRIKGRDMTAKEDVEQIENETALSV